MNKVTIKKWNGINAVYMENDLSETIVTFRGAHVVSFIPKGGKDLLWISKESSFAPGAAIRGGIPVCWPWFGKVKLPAHGFARTEDWTLVSSAAVAGGGTEVVFEYTPTDSEYSFLGAKVKVSAGRSLKVSLTTENRGKEAFSLTDALHTYFAVSGIKKAAVTGLSRSKYFDKLTGKVRTQSGKITFDRETDRIYASSGTASIEGARAGRVIEVAKSGSAATVVWNPWIDKAHEMENFGDREYLKMLCVEAANAWDDAVMLLPGRSHTLTTTITEKSAAESGTAKK